MKKQFKAETKRLLDLMINSIYTHKEIFLRELISNASDASDKRYFHENGNISKQDLKIQIELNKEERTISIHDNGIGMDEKDLEQFLGTIAKSDSFQFKQNQKEDTNIIGQFGVGFYASFMVADKIQVITKKQNQAYLFESSNEDGYTIEKTEKENIGTTVILYLKQSADDENYDEFLEENYIEFLVKKYSDYIRYPIILPVSEAVYDEKGEITSESIVNKTLNSMVPLWKNNKNEISQQQYDEFYKEKFHDMENPLLSLHLNIEGNVSFQSLLYIPNHLPYNYYTQEFKKGLQLYSSGVFIMENAENLISEHFRFIRGMVDSDDLSLNISRELLQHDRQLTQIAKVIDKKIKSELLQLQKNEREKYEKFWSLFGSQIKYGIYQNFGEHKLFLQDLLLFYSQQHEKLLTLKEIVENKEEKIIYYATGESKFKLQQLPQVNALLKKGKDVLLLDDRIDEFAITMMQKYEDYEFKNVATADIDVLNEEEKQKVDAMQQLNQDLLSKLSTLLKGKVEKVVLSKKLVEDAVCLSSGNGISFEMEKTLNALENGQKVHASKILEINPNHAIFEYISTIQDEDTLQSTIELLYNQALLIEGFELDNPLQFSKQLCDLMLEKNK